MCVQGSRLGDSKQGRSIILGDGKVALLNAESEDERQGDPSTQNGTPSFDGSPMMQYLVSAFKEDYVNKRFVIDRSGWRSLMDLVNSLKIPRSQAYGDGRYGHTFGRPLEILFRMGLVEHRIFSGKGRGGNVLKIRACYEKESVRTLVDGISTRSFEVPVEGDDGLDGTPPSNEDSNLRRNVENTALGQNCITGALCGKAGRGLWDSEKWLSKFQRSPFQYEHAWKREVKNDERENLTSVDIINNTRPSYCCPITRFCTRDLHLERGVYW